MSRDRIREFVLEPPFHEVNSKTGILSEIRTNKLISLLNDPCREIRERVFWYLAAYRPADEEVEESLIDVAKKSHRSRGSLISWNVVVYGLAKAAPRWHVHKLISLLKGHGDLLCQVAAEALAKRSSRAIRVALIEAFSFRHDCLTRTSILKALGNYSTIDAVATCVNPIQMKRSCCWDCLCEALDSLERILTCSGQNVWEYLFSTCTYHFVLHRAARALAGRRAPWLDQYRRKIYDIGGEAAQQHLILRGLKYCAGPLKQQLIDEALSSDNWKLRYCALDAIASRGSLKACQLLCAYFTDPHERVVKQVGDLFMYRLAHRWSLGKLKLMLCSLGRINESKVLQALRPGTKMNGLYKPEVQKFLQGSV